jgi:hypothetical protein
MSECDKEIYEKGIVVFITHTMSSKDIEDWVQIISVESGQKVDWHWYAGRAAIKALGNIKQVKSAIKNNRAIHDQSFSKALEKFEHCKGHTDENERTIQGIWDYNGL